MKDSLEKQLISELQDQELLSKKEIQECLRYQEKLESAGKSKTFSKIVLKKGLVSKKELTQVLQAVKDSQLNATEEKSGKSSSPKSERKSKTLRNPKEESTKAKSELLNLRALSRTSGNRESENPPKKKNPNTNVNTSTSTGTRSKTQRLSSSKSSQNISAEKKHTQRLSRKINLQKQSQVLDSSDPYEQLQTKRVGHKEIAALEKDETQEFPRTKTQRVKPKSQRLKPKTQRIKPKTQRVKPKTERIKPSITTTPKRSSAALNNKSTRRLNLAASLENTSSKISRPTKVITQKIDQHLIEKIEGEENIGLGRAVVFLMLFCGFLLLLVVVGVTKKYYSTEKDKRFALVTPEGDSSSPPNPKPSTKISPEEKYSKVTLNEVMGWVQQRNYFESYKALGYLFSKAKETDEDFQKIERLYLHVSHQILQKYHFEAALEMPSKSNVVEINYNFAERMYEKDFFVRDACQYTDFRYQLSDGQLNHNARFYDFLKLTLDFEHQASTGELYIQALGYQLIYPCNGKKITLNRFGDENNPLWEGDSVALSKQNSLSLSITKDYLRLLCGDKVLFKVPSKEIRDSGIVIRYANPTLKDQKDQKNQKNQKNLKNQKGLLLGQMRIFSKFYPEWIQKIVERYEEH